MITPTNAAQHRPVAPGRAISRLADGASIPKRTSSEVRGRLDAVERRSERIEAAIHELARALGDVDPGPPYDDEPVRRKLAEQSGTITDLVAALEAAGIIEVMLMSGIRACAVGLAQRPEDVEAHEIARSVVE